MAAVRPYFPDLGELRSALVEIEYRAEYVRQVLRDRRPLTERRRSELLEELTGIGEAASAQNTAAQWAEVAERLDRVNERAQRIAVTLGIEEQPELTLVPGGGDH